MVRFALETGLCRSNVTGLQWSPVDIVRRVALPHPDQANAKETITVPLSDTTVTVLQRRLAKRWAPEYVDSVFVRHGRPVYQTVTDAWCRR
ncbi:Site-specific recombinase, phage integrase family [Burkholderia lata]|nr:Site-specific recombinase, phage integrase family [Burkholderia lata]